MKPVSQKVISANTGDCFRACLASILECDDAPTFVDTDKDSQWEQYNRWLKPQKLQLCFYEPRGSGGAPYGYSILLVKSALFTGKAHAVVAYRDESDDLTKIVFNPNPEDPRGCTIPYEDWLFYEVISVRLEAK